MDYQTASAERIDPMPISAAVCGFIIPVLAFSASFCGALTAVSAGKLRKKGIGLLMGTAAGIMLALAFTELLPMAEAALSLFPHRWLIIVPLVLLGFFFTALPDIRGKNGDHSSAGFRTAAAIALHNVPEGMASFAVGAAAPALQLGYGLAIVMHEFPLGATAAAGMLLNSGSRKKVLLTCAAAACAQPLGALAAYLFLSDVLTPSVMGCLYCIMCGVVAYTALFTLLPSARDCSKFSPAAVCGGILLMLMIEGI